MLRVAVSRQCRISGSPRVCSQTATLEQLFFSATLLATQPLHSRSLDDAPEGRTPLRAPHSRCDAEDTQRGKTVVAHTTHTRPSAHAARAADMMHKFLHVSLIASRADSPKIENPIVTADSERALGRVVCRVSRRVVSYRVVSPSPFLICHKRQQKTLTRAHTPPRSPQCGRSLTRSCSAPVLTKIVRRAVTLLLDECTTD